jgi:hypothetical protein
MSAPQNPVRLVGDTQLGRLSAGPGDTMERDHAIPDADDPEGL